MDIWAPVVRNAADNTVANFTHDASTFTVATINQLTYRTTANLTDTAAHDSAGNQWTDAYGEMVIPAFTTGANIKCGVWLRVADASNCYTVVADSATTTITISKVVAGTPTSLGTGTFTLGATFPVILRAEIQGDLIRAWWKGRHIVTVQDSTLTGPGFVSMYLRTSSAAADVTASRWEAGPLTTPPTRHRRLGR